VQRLVTACGPQILRAINDQLEPAQQTALLRLADASDSMAPVRKR
jgi:hypothetical protein